ncbi:PP2C family protein-serine/threonine phosphatase [Kineococcus glutinatus]|uniref:PP2C family protein-serine/threonine phosphatase n=1 Tax=Kineococcus glutinatus TaxID=1070872 RepID=A0ABP9H9A3_9ACTN
MRAGTVLALALGWVLALWGVQFAAGGRLVVVPWLALGPLAASLVLGWRPTAAVALTSVLAVAHLSHETGDLLDGVGEVRVAGSAALAGFAVFGARVRVRREERIRAVTEVATVAQTAILHPVPAQVGGLVLASRYVSADAAALVGGDLFDVVARDGSVRVVVGDARGKGLPAVHTAAAVLSAFRHSAPLEGPDLDDVARAVDAAVSPSLGPEDFVTAVLCEVHPDGRLDVVRCGHPAPLLLAPGRAPREVGATSCPPLGMGVEPVVEADRLEPGERLLLHTDGLLEARDAEGRFFDLTAAVQDLAGPGASPGVPAADDLDAALERLLARVRAHVGGTLTDDVAVLLLERARIPA